MAAKRRFVTCEQLVETEDCSKERLAATRCASTARMVDGVIETPGGAHFTECPPDYGRDEAFQREYAASAKDADALADVPREAASTSHEADYQRAVRAREERSDERTSTRAEICAVAVAEAFRGDGEILASPLRHACRDRRAAREAHVRARPADDRRRRARCVANVLPVSRHGARRAGRRGLAAVPHASSTCSGRAAAT